MKKNTLLTQEEGTWLLDFVISKIAAVVHKTPHPYQAPETLLQKKYGVFITLFKNDTLRGCFGDPYPKGSIVETIEYLLEEGGLEDPQANELPDLQVEISILTRPIPIVVEQIEIGVHGLILENKSLILPKVAIENRWSVETYLEKLCLKANLPKETWKEGAKLFSFQVQTIS